MGWGLGGIKVEDRLSHLSPFTFTWVQGAGRPRVTAPEPRPPGLQVNKSENQSPLREGGSYLVPLLSQSR